MAEFTFPDGFTADCYCVDCEASALVLKACIHCGDPLCEICTPICVECGDAADADH